MSHVLVESHDRVAVITINRPERRNAIDLPTAEALAAAFDELDARDDLSVAVLTGAGATFCAGMDLKALRVTGERPYTQSRGMFGIAERPPEKPIIAAVEGHALGGGFEIALACDLIIAGAGACFGLPEVKRGLVASAGGMIRLPRRIPRGIALELVLTGASITADRGETLGLLNGVCESGRACDVAVALAARIAENAPLAVRAAKQAVYETVELSIADAFSQQEPTVQMVRDSEDAREGTLAFVEKRPAVWRGK